MSGTIVTSIVQGQEVRFFVTNPRDDRQAVHFRGRFFEMPVLEFFRKVLKPGAIFLDVGANVGNHTLWAEKFLGIAEVIPIEPNPEAIEILRANIALNGLRRVNLQHLGLALSDEAAAHDITVVENNLGWATVVGDDLSEIDLLRGRRPQFYRESPKSGGVAADRATLLGRRRLGAARDPCQSSAEPFSRA